MCKTRVKQSSSYSVTKSPSKKSFKSNLPFTYLKQCKIKYPKLGISLTRNKFRGIFLGTSKGRLKKIFSVLLKILYCRKVMKKMRKLLTLVLTLALVASLIAGCGGGADGGAAGGAAQAGAAQGGAAATPEAAAQEDAGGRTDIIIGTDRDVVTTDPHDTNDAPSGDVNRQIYSALLRQNPQYEFVPDLALSWEPISPTEWQFNLRQGVLWHDGTPFTANDVRFSIMRQQEERHGQVRHLVAAVADVIVVDDYTVIIETYEPFGPILVNLAHSATRIVPAHAADDLANNPIGTGPMRFVSRVPGVEIRLERFDDYFGDLAMATSLTYMIIADGPARTIALETGEVDMILMVPAVDVDRIHAHPELRLIEDMSNRFEWLGFNMNKAPFDNVLVRRAIAHSLDREGMNIVGYEGRAAIANSFTGPTVFGYNPNIEPLVRNLDLARELLAEAGFPDGFETILWTSGAAREMKAQIIQANLAEIGITASIEVLEWAAYLDRTSAGEHYMHMLSWANLTGDADPGMWPLYHTASQGAGNRSFFSNERVDELLELGRRETNQPARVPFYHEIQEILRYYLPVVPLHILPIEFAIRAGLEGYELHPGGLHRFYNLHFPE